MLWFFCCLVSYQIIQLFPFKTPSAAVINRKIGTDYNGVKHSLCSHKEYSGFDQRYPNTSNETLDSFVIHMDILRKIEYLERQKNMPIILLDDTIHQILRDYNIEKQSKL